MVTKVKLTKSQKKAFRTRKTTIWHILQLAWILLHASDRKYLRLTQILLPADAFYLENDELIRRIRGRYQR